MDQTQHDELAALFAQRMNFANSAMQQQHQQQHQHQHQGAPVEHLLPAPPEEKLASPHYEAPVTFTSSHYTHTTHIRPSGEASSESSHSPPPPYHESPMPEAMAQLLLQHSIEPSSLLPNQIHLFANADYEQRLRLVELWRIAPPSYLPLKEHVHASWAPTTMKQEEDSARLRYENAMIARERREHSLMEFNTHLEPMSPIRELGETPWPPAARMRAASIASSRPSTRHNGDPEPYMVTGYQDTAQQHQQRLEQIYAAAGGAETTPLHTHELEDQEEIMGDWYGALIQVRNHADWEALNERVAREKLASAAASSIHDIRTDEDMEM